MQGNRNVSKNPTQISFSLARDAPWVVRLINSIFAFGGRRIIWMGAAIMALRCNSKTDIAKPSQSVPNARSYSACWEFPWTLNFRKVTINPR